MPARVYHLPNFVRMTQRYLVHLFFVGSYAQINTSAQLALICGGEIRRALQYKYYSC